MGRRLFSLTKYVYFFGSNITKNLEFDNVFLENLKIYVNQFSILLNLIIIIECSS